MPPWSRIARSPTSCGISCANTASAVTMPRCTSVMNAAAISTPSSTLWKPSPIRMSAPRRRRGRDRASEHARHDGPRTLPGDNGARAPSSRARRTAAGRQAASGRSRCVFSQPAPSIACGSKPSSAAPSRCAGREAHEMRQHASAQRFRRDAETATPRARSRRRRAVKRRIQSEKRHLGLRLLATGQIGQLRQRRFLLDSCSVARASRRLWRLPVARQLSSR